MIVALLILITFILLFGAAAVKGWIANAAGIGCGFAVFVCLVLWVGSHFGEDGVENTVYVICGVGLLLALWAAYEEGERKAKAKKPIDPSPMEKPPIQFHSNAPSEAERRRLRNQFRDNRERPPF